MHGMQESQSCAKQYLHNEIMQSIINHAINAEYEIIQKNNPPGPCFLPGLIRFSDHPLSALIKSFYHIQLISKYYQDIFWSFFTGHAKEQTILFWLHGNKFHRPDNNYFIDIAKKMKINLSFALLRVVSLIEFHRQEPCENCANFMREIVPMCNTEEINYSDDTTDTPLRSMIKCDHIDMVKLLLSCPTIDVNKDFPLHLATFHQDVEIVKLLLAHPDIQINATNAQGETALFKVVKHSPNFQWPTEELHLIIKLLVEAGIDSSIVNKDGETANEVALRRSKIDFCDRLQEAMHNVASHKQ